MLADARHNVPSPDRQVPMTPGMESREEAGSAGGFVAEISRMFEGGAIGNSLSGGLNELVSRFKSSGWGKPVNSWVSTGPNLPMDANDLRSVIGDETLGELSIKTGMTQEQLLLRLNAALPEVVNGLTPEGRVPTQVEALSLI